MIIAEGVSGRKNKVTWTRIETASACFGLDLDDGGMRAFGQERSHTVIRVGATKVFYWTHTPSVRDTGALRHS